MIKKILLLSLPVVAIALLSFQIASADYYDCDGIRREGQARPNIYNGCWSTERPIEQDLDIRKLRKYCVRNYCYVIYEICEENGRCVEESKRIKKDDYEEYEQSIKKTKWRDWTRQKTYQYFYDNYSYTKRNYDYVYRGTRFGGYNDRYWDF